MKSILLITAVAVIAFTSAGCQSPQPQAQASTPQAELTNPFIGTWKIVYGEYYSSDKADTTFQSEQDEFQIKLHTKDYFAVFNRGDGGNYEIAAVGNYEVDGNKFTEHFNDILQIDGSRHPMIGGAFTMEWELNGDTLYMKGPVEAKNAAGERMPDLENAWFEKRVRLD